MPPAIIVQDVSKVYRLGTIGRGTIQHEVARRWAKFRRRPDPSLPIGEARHAASREFWALKDVSFQLQPGEVLGIIGGNGAGKSTLLKILSQIAVPTTGSIRIRGRIASLLEVGTGFHPELTGRENVFLNGAILGMTRAEIHLKFDEIIEFSGIGAFIDTPVKRYSSGMYVRLAFAVAAHLDPEILIVDEVLAVGDSEFQAKCLGRMHMAATSGRTVLFVSHNMQAVATICGRGIFLRDGSVVMDGAIRPVVDNYLSTIAQSVAKPSDPDRRPGTGEYRFATAQPVLSHFTCEQVKSVSFQIIRRRPLGRDLFLSAHLVAPDGTVIVQCDSRLVGTWLKESDSSSGEFQVRTPWLKPGRYRLDLFLVGHGIVDEWENACSLSVSPLLPYAGLATEDASKLGVVFADFSWTLNDAPN